MPGEKTTLEMALAALGPLEARIMREAWTGTLGEPFIVRDMRGRMLDLAYTTVMTILNRLADKGLLEAQRMGRQRPTQYRVRWTPEAFLAESSRQGAEEFVQRYGEAALVAFAARLETLTLEQRERLERLVQREQ